MVVKYSERFSPSPMPLRYTHGFRTERLKLRHFQDHIEDDGDFPCATPDEYEEMADEFCGKPPTPTMRVYTRRYGDKAGGVVRWDTATDEYGVVNSDGYISTYFKVAYEHGTNEEYFELERIKDESRRP
jgi:hypothetical protein